ncbi:MAG: hypothetical protein PHE73_04065 [Sulfurovaceae bacterium]|nr:hypothetical protein [Sulfurovaceae bacterium]
MKNILILAEGKIAKHFIVWLSKKRVANNHYHIASNTILDEDIKNNKNIAFSNIDATSYSKLDHILEEKNYSHVFIIMESYDDVKHIIHNLNTIDDKLRIILLNQWDDKKTLKFNHNVIILDMYDLISGHLYDKLPNVPLLANNIGVGQGEIMEIHIPFGSSYAYRHVGSIVQQKWKITALYRDGKQILPTSATMIRPNDTLLVVGRPTVLNGIYKLINKRKGLFPEPFGKNIYLLLDLRHDKKKAIDYIKEAIQLKQRLQNKELFIRVVHPSNLKLTEEIKAFRNENVHVNIYYGLDGTKDIIEYDISQYDIGLVMCSQVSLYKEYRNLTFYYLRKLVYLFGNIPLININSAVILMQDEEKMESISSTAFDLCEILKLPLKLCDFDPDGDFSGKKMIIDHYETMANLFNSTIIVEQKIANPIRELSKMRNILHITSFQDKAKHAFIWQLIVIKMSNLFPSIYRHPKLLIPFESSDA